MEIYHDVNHYLKQIQRELKDFWNKIKSWNFPQVDKTVSYNKMVDISIQKYLNIFA